ncbi:O-antigen ligase [Andreprevotia lacus DSM 23236]|jgi:O-antigen ligase|uniref:O-antigen ligase n=1 Tax=Andreprevotia lacus DSM 23236 TaxID=1121001 RepID=A0A1W1XTW9_9NEIS|nr:O-antigen ligase family protein [Andreprevotia lacus]SMC27337.1 O-antigen ligase [Andreprevotia lacus DSM 23236]
MNQLFSRQNLPLVIPALIAGVAIPLSTALINIGTGLVVLAALAMLYTPQGRSHLVQAFRQPFVIGCLALYAMFVLGMLWTAEPATAGVHMLGKMRPYLLAPLIFAACSTRAARQALLGGFTAAALLSAVVSIASGLAQHPVMKGMPGDYTVFQTHTYHNTFLALVACGILAFWLAGRIPPAWRKVSALVFVVCVVDILFFVSGRTAQGILLLLLAALVVMWQGRRGVIFALAGLAIALPALYFGSNVIRKGIERVQVDVSQYQQGNAETSVGLRFYFWQHAVILIKQAPWLGHGTGSYEKQYRELTQQYKGEFARANPHSDYLWLWAELGIGGVLLLLFMQGTLAVQAYRLPAPERWVGWTLCLCYASSTVANSFFTDNVTGTPYVLLGCALTAGRWLSREPEAAKA